MYLNVFSVKAELCPVGRFYYNVRAGIVDCEDLKLQPERLICAIPCKLTEGMSWGSAVLHIQLDIFTGDDMLIRSEIERNCERIRGQCWDNAKNNGLLWQVVAWLWHK